MASVARNARQQKKGQWRAGLQRRAKRSGTFAYGTFLVALAMLLLLALASYRPSDPAFNTAAAGPVRNWLGAPGAYTSDLLLSIWGPPAGLLVPLIALIGLRITRGAYAGRWVRALLLTLLGISSLGVAAALLAGGAINGLPAGWGGALGLSLARLASAGIAAIGQPDVEAPLRGVLIGLFALAGLLLCYFALGLRSEERHWLQSLRQREREAADYDEDLPDPDERPARAPVMALAEPHRTIIADRARTPNKGRRPLRERQAALPLGDNYVLPTIDLLNPPPPPVNVNLDKASLERNARLLESVLEDFSVKGEIVEVRPGPVVTMYELEPASGIKASRVIQLADDIARNMRSEEGRVG